MFERERETETERDRERDRERKRERERGREGTHQRALLGERGVLLDPNYSIEADCNNL